MSITYKTEKLQCDRIYRRDESAGSFSFVQYGHSSWDILETTTAVGDNIIFAQNNTNGGKFWKVELNIATAIDVTSINGVWEARGELTSKYGNTWTPVTVISDTSNMFQNAGIQTIEIIPPDLWENIAVATGLNFYAWNLRFRITDIGTINNVGNISYVYTYPNRIVVDAETFTMKDVYDADVFNGWGVVSKNGSSYSVNASIKANSNTTFNTKAETITFLDNYMAYFLGTVNVGELSSTNKPLNGSTIMMYGSNSDYNNNYFGKDNSTYYDMTIKFPRKNCEVASQGFWSAGVGAYSGQKVAGGSLAGFRNYGFSHNSVVFKNFKFADAFIEPNKAVMIDCEVNASHYITRPNAYSIGTALHRMNGVDIISASTNPWNVTYIEDWYMMLVDCKLDLSRDLAQWRIFTTSPFYPNNSIQVINSLQLKVTNSNSIGLDGANVSIFDKDNNKVNSLISNTDGFVGTNIGTVGASCTTSKIDNTSIDLTGKNYREILMTSGVTAGSRSVVMETNTTSAKIIEEFSSAPVSGDRFVEVPYIIYMKEVCTSGTDNTTIRISNGDFRVSYRKYGYVFSDDTLSFDAPMVSLKGLSTNNYTVLSDPSVLTGIAIDGIAKTITVSESRTSSELYDYTQYWATLVDNLIYDEPLKTFDGVNYLLTNGWKLILSTNLSSQLNISGEVNLVTGVNLSNMSIDGDLRVSTGLNSELNFSNVTVLGSVYNDSVNNTLTINSLNGSSMTAGDAGIGNGQTNIVTLVSLTLVGLVDGSDVVILEAGTDNVLDSVDQNAGTSYVYGYSTAQTRCRYWSD